MTPREMRLLMQKRPLPEPVGMEQVCVATAGTPEDPEV
eukprot:CAMPEP_0117575120 /NCGR_PEP_ID=MMETSP0784-20121206/62029_1 /TAXON_ID=39447 /ORGANISM="" /LENGTH=37 /DNA_ID= /DNA_START= /DNA_END= /DNA_ORIENTATION=